MLQRKKDGGNKGESANATRANDSRDDTKSKSTHPSERSHALSCTAPTDTTDVAIAVTSAKIRNEVYDTGAFCHMTPYRGQFTRYLPLKVPTPIAIPNGTSLQAT